MSELRERGLGDLVNLMCAERSSLARYAMLREVNTDEKKRERYEQLMLDVGKRIGEIVAELNHRERVK